MKSKNKQRTRLRLTYFAFCLLPLCVSCKTQPALVLQTVVGPSASAVSLVQLDSSSEGFLKVFSATETRQADDKSKYHPHTDYTIFNTNGSVFRWVENSLDVRDEAAALVYLPAGFYTVQAQDDNYGLVSVPVLIQTWRTTKVYLDARKIDSLEHMNPSSSVCLPNGRIVGWRASELAPNTDHGSH